MNQFGMRFRKFQNTTGKPLQWYSYTIAVVYPSCFEIYENASQTGSQRNLRCMFSILNIHLQWPTKRYLLFSNSTGLYKDFHFTCSVATLPCEVVKFENPKMLPNFHSEIQSRRTAASCQRPCGHAAACSPTAFYCYTCVYVAQWNECCRS